MVAVTLSWFRREAGQPSANGSPELAGGADENSRRKLQNVVTDRSVAGTAQAAAPETNSQLIEELRAGKRSVCWASEFRAPR